MKTYHFYYYVPETHLEQTKQAIFAAGAGKIGNYSNCAWEIKGAGQFKPEAESKPYLGEIGKIAKVIEYKVETICPENRLQDVVTALKLAHPYEYPAFGAVLLSRIANS
jgi:hypothetical protein